MKIPLTSGKSKFIFYESNILTKKTFVESIVISDNILSFMNKSRKNS